MLQDGCSKSSHHIHIPDRRQAGRKTTEGRRKGTLSAQSVILLRRFPGSLPKFFGYISWARSVSSNHPYLKGPGKCPLVWIVALSTKLGSVVKKERMGIGTVSSRFFL